MMRWGRQILVIAVLFGVCQANLKAQSGSKIRSKAPMTALVYDLQGGNLSALERAYFDYEIDFFLDYQGVQNSVAKELFYLREAGRAIDSGNIVTARNYLRGVTKYVDEKTYVEAVILAAEKKYEQSMRIFKDLVERRRSLPRNLAVKSMMGAARVAHEVGDYSQAIFYYSRIRQLDKLFFQSIFEKAWSFYQSGDMNGALGATLSFMTPYSENVFYPETYIVRAASFYQLCLFERANQTIEDMKKVFIPIQKQIKELQRRNIANWLFTDEVLRSVDNRVLAYMISDPSFRSLQRAHLSLVDEVKRLTGVDAVKANEALKFVKSRLMQRATQVLRKADAELSSAVEQADTIQIEILQLGVNVLTGAPVELRDDLRIIELGDVDFDEQIQFWPFHGEFWLDEIGSYYYGLKSQCQSAQAP